MLDYILEAYIRLGNKYDLKSVRPQCENQFGVDTAVTFFVSLQTYQRVNHNSSREKDHRGPYYHIQAELSFATVSC